MAQPGYGRRPGTGAPARTGREDNRIWARQFVAFFDVSTTWSQLSLRDMERDLAAADATRPPRQRAARRQWCAVYVESACATAM
jgi:hypothetical protein